MGSETDWCILRTSASQTLQLAASLNDAGFEAWTPTKIEPIRVGEARSRRKVITPLLPRYVFAPAHSLQELLNLSRSPSLQYRVWDAELRCMVVRGHPAFGLFRDASGFGQVSESELTSLRREERRATPKDKIRAFLASELVKVIDGPWQGLVGVVVGSSGLHVSVEFPQSNIAPKLPIWTLQHIEQQRMEKAA